MHEKERERMIEKSLITLEETREILGVGINRIYMLAKTPGFPSIKIGKKYYVNKNAIQHWIDEQTGQEIE